MTLLSDTKFNSGFYVYALCYPGLDYNITHEDYTFPCKPFYVGKGRYGRWDVHTNEALTTSSSNRKSNIIRYLHKMSKEVSVYILFQSDDEELCYEKESYYINAIGRKNDNTGILVNLTGGGEGFGSGSNHHIHAKVLDGSLNILQDKEFFDDVRRKSNQRMMDDGTHHFLNSEWQGKLTQERYDNGTHYLQGEGVREDLYKKSINPETGRHPMADYNAKHGRVGKDAYLQQIIHDFVSNLSEGVYIVDMEFINNVFSEYNDNKVITSRSAWYRALTYYCSKDKCDTYDYTFDESTVRKTPTSKLLWNKLTKLKKES